MSLCLRWRIHSGTAMALSDTLMPCREVGRRLLLHWECNTQNGKQSPLAASSLLSSSPPGSVWDARCLWQNYNWMLLLDAGSEGCLEGWVAPLLLSSAASLHGLSGALYLLVWMIKEEPISWCPTITMWRRPWVSKEAWWLITQLVSWAF